jgi:NOL1/NOP2/fmu family ribosome biogenesis protein
MIKKLDRLELKQFCEYLEKYYGIEEDFNGYVLLWSGKNKIRLTTIETYEFFEKMKKAESIGIYIAKRIGTDWVLSIEGTQLIGNKIKKNFIELNREEAEKWMKGEPIKIKSEISSKFIIGKYNGTFLGSGRVISNTIYPYVSKWRRITRTCPTSYHS